MNYLLHVGVTVTIIKVFIIPFLLVRIENIICQNKLVSSAFNWLPRYIFFLTKLRGRERPFLKGARRGALLWLLDPLTNKYYRTWGSIVNLWIDSRTYQRFLLSARQRSSNHLELSKENFGGNMMLSHWPCFIWKFMIWFRSILKSIFQMQSSCPRNICAEHWRKLPNLTAFLESFSYYKNIDSVEHV